MVEEFLIDDKLFKVKFVEELDLGLPSDVCFEDFEPDSISEFSNVDDAPEHDHIIDSLVHELKEVCEILVQLTRIILLLTLLLQVVVLKCLKTNQLSMFTSNRLRTQVILRSRICNFNK